ncbi:MAG: RnfABCDGE type electron transport complex subunit D [bacterium]|nr:RnfABCDGE type electron transport complex subunit D [bacterium]
MSAEANVVELRTSPHVKQQVSTDSIMFNVAVALIPVCLFSVYVFGLSALALLVTTAVTCVLTEHIVCRLSHRESTVGDYSIVVTGLLLGLTLPPGLPLWMAVAGSVFGVVIGKSLFGGLGYNKFNPALVGRAFLQASFPVAITTWTPAFVSPAQRFTSFIPTTFTLPFLSPSTKAAALADYVSGVDGWAGATPLALWKFSDVPIATGALKLFAGMTAGSTGETCAILIILGGIYLVARRMMNWRIPVSMLLAVFVVSGIFYLFDKDQYANPFFMLFSGGLMLGAVFMASDMVASPTSTLGVWIYGAFIGVLTAIIRIKGALPEGVMYAILLGNAVSPIIENLTQPKIYGATKATAK